MTNLGSSLGATYGSHPSLIHEYGHHHHVAPHSSHGYPIGSHHHHHLIPHAHSSVSSQSHHHHISHPQAHHHPSHISNNIHHPHPGHPDSHNFHHPIPHAHPHHLSLRDHHPEITNRNLPSAGGGADIESLTDIRSDNFYEYRTSLTREDGTRSANSTIFGQRAGPERPATTGPTVLNSLVEPRPRRVFRSDTFSGELEVRGHGILGNGTSSSMSKVHHSSQSHQHPGQTNSSQSQSHQSQMDSVSSGLDQCQQSAARERSETIDRSQHNLSRGAGTRSRGPPESSYDQNFENHNNHNASTENLNNMVQMSERKLHNEISSLGGASPPAYPLQHGQNPALSGPTYTTTSQYHNSDSLFGNVNPPWAALNQGQPQTQTQTLLSASTNIGAVHVLPPDESTAGTTTGGGGTTATVTTTNATTTSTGTVVTHIISPTSGGGSNLNHNGPPPLPEPLPPGPNQNQNHNLNFPQNSVVNSTVGNTLSNGPSPSTITNGNVTGSTQAGTVVNQNHQNHQNQNLFNMQGLGDTPQLHPSQFSDPNQSISIQGGISVQNQGNSMMMQQGQVSVQQHQNQMQTQSTVIVNNNDSMNQNPNNIVQNQNNPTMIQQPNMTPVQQVQQHQMNQNDIDIDGGSTFNTLFGTLADHECLPYYRSSQGQQNNVTSSGGPGPMPQFPGSMPNTDQNQNNIQQNQPGPMDQNQIHQSNNLNQNQINQNGNLNGSYNNNNIDHCQRRDYYHGLMGTGTPSLDAQAQAATNNHQGNNMYGNNNMQKGNGKSMNTRNSIGGKDGMNLNDGKYNGFNNNSSDNQYYNDSYGMNDHFSDDIPSSLYNRNMNSGKNQSMKGRGKKGMQQGNNINNMMHNNNGNMNHNGMGMMNNNMNQNYGKGGYGMMNENGRGQMDQHPAAAMDRPRSKVVFPKSCFKYDSLIKPSREELNAETSELYGEVLSVIQTQAGSKMIQKLLTEDEIATRLILCELEPHLLSLMIDRYANYCCSLIFSALPVESKRNLIYSLTPSSLEQISYDKRGTHALQALLDALDSDEIACEAFLKNIEPSFLTLALDSNATHVIQKCLQCFPVEVFIDNRSNIFKLVVREFVNLVQHAHGLCVIKEAMTHSPDPVMLKQRENYDESQDLCYRTELLWRLVENTRTIIECPFGNYALQHALSTWGWVYTQPIMNCLRGKFAYLSTQKFSSNVVECILSHCPPPAFNQGQTPNDNNNINTDDNHNLNLNNNFLDILLDELLCDKSISNLISSMYGWYVIRKALSIATYSQLDRIKISIEGALNNLPGGNRKLKQKWERILDGSGGN